jgi:hypothetical protein
MTANAINVLSGTTLTVDSGATITNSGTANNFGTTTIGGLTDVTMDATNFKMAFLFKPASDGSAPTTGTLSTATGNVGIGHNVMKTVTTGDYNVVLGENAGDALTEASDCVVIGSQAGTDLTTGVNNVFDRSWCWCFNYNWC